MNCYPSFFLGRPCLNPVLLRTKTLLDFTFPVDRVSGRGLRVRRCGRKGGEEMDLPKCQKCNNGLLIPLSDYGQDGASVMFKAWACTNPDCGFSLRVDKGEVTYGKRIEPKH
jgi:hypothetical protein